jgi:phosphoglucosamine mutase
MENQGRVLVRASGTEPVIRVMVEAKTQNIVDFWTEKLVKATSKYLAA